MLPSLTFPPHPSVPPPSRLAADAGAGGGAGEEEEDAVADCSDVAEYRDASGYSCGMWVGYDCAAAEGDYGYRCVRMPEGALARAALQHSVLVVWS